MKKYLTFIGLFIANALACSVYSIVPPYLPSEAKEKGASNTITGLLLSGYPIAALISSFLIGKYIGIIGKKRTLLLGCISESIATFGFANLPSYSYTPFLILGFGFRLMQGLGAGLLGTAIYALITSEYSNEMQKYLGILQISNALGFMLGPLGASALYALGGFPLIFYIYSLIYIIILPFVWFTVAPDKKSENPETEINSYEVLKSKNISYYALVLISCAATLCFLTPTYSLHLINLGVEKELLGAIFAVPTISYILCIYPVSHSRFSLKQTMIIGLVLLGAGALLVGPWKYLMIPKHVFVSVTATLIIGCGICASQLTALPEMITSAQLNFPTYRSELISDIISGIANSCTFIAEMFAPGISGYLADWIGFESSQAFLGLGILGLAVMFKFIDLHSEKSAANFELSEVKEKLVND